MMFTEEAYNLIYPHHETILGQLRALTNIARPVNCWTHVGTVTIRGNKMSNSLSNTLKIQISSKRILAQRHKTLPFV